MIPAVQNPTICSSHWNIEQQFTLDNTFSASSFSVILSISKHLLFRFEIRSQISKYPHCSSWAAPHAALPLHGCFDSTHWRRIRWSPCVAKDEEEPSSWEQSCINKYGVHHSWKLLMLFDMFRLVFMIILRYVFLLLFLGGVGNDLKLLILIPMNRSLHRPARQSVDLLRGLVATGGWSPAVAPKNVSISLDFTTELHSKSELYFMQNLWDLGSLYWTTIFSLQTRALKENLNEWVCLNFTSSDTKGSGSITGQNLCPDLKGYISIQIWNHNLAL